MILNGAAKTLATSIPCEADGEIGFCVFVTNVSGEVIDRICPPGGNDLALDEENECPNEDDVSPQKNALTVRSTCAVSQFRYSEWLSEYGFGFMDCAFFIQWE